MPTPILEAYTAKNEPLRTKNGSTRQRNGWTNKTPSNKNEIHEINIRTTMSEIGTKCADTNPLYKAEKAECSDLERAASSAAALSALTSRRAQKSGTRAKMTGTFVRATNTPNEQSRDLAREGRSEQETEGEIRDEIGISLDMHERAVFTTKQELLERKNSKAPDGYRGGAYERPALARNGRRQFGRRTTSDHRKRTIQEPALRLFDVFSSLNEERAKIRGTETTFPGATLPDYRISPSRNTAFFAVECIEK
ncbi:hypothetical protein C8R45DRAFT_927396 [Mycena sanguinolenta]|nr:hypothetical protein C8R45DRAFT_927396 [Mycena sanguinolenta]